MDSTDSSSANENPSGLSIGERRRLNANAQDQLARNKPTSKVVDYLIEHGIDKDDAASTVAAIRTELDERQSTFASAQRKGTALAVGMIIIGVAIVIYGLVTNSFNSVVIFAGVAVLGIYNFRRAQGRSFADLVAAQPTALAS